MGVVNSFLPANKISDGFVCSLTLIDESRLEVDCSMFHTTLVSLPHQLYPGDILCVREGATEGLAPHVALRMDMRSAWVVFRKNDRYKQLACSMTHQLSAKAPEMVRVEELKKWSTPNGGCNGSDGGCNGSDGGCNGSDGGCSGSDGGCNGSDGCFEVVFLFPRILS